MKGKGLQGMGQQGQQRQLDARIAKGRGSVILYDASLIDHADRDLFDIEVWRGRGDVTTPDGGRGEAWIIRGGDREWVLRHYRRGGIVGRYVRDSYIFTGWAMSRPVREWRITARLYEMGLPVPRPVAAAGWRRGLLYRADLITERVPGVTLGSQLGKDVCTPGLFRDIGKVVARLHNAGLWHSDLNVKNILVADGRVSVIDFDKARWIRSQPALQRNLMRLERSLYKSSARRAIDESRTAALWLALTAGYREGRSAST